MRTTIVRADDHETSAREHRVVASTEGFTPQICGFDPLQDIINLAHAEGIEVHAFVIMNAIWGRAPNLFPPENPNRVFNLHGGYDAATNTIIPGPNNWLTRTLLADTTPGSTAISFQGHRFGSDFWLDFGHPDAAAYTSAVVKHLVQSYDIDGLHLGSNSGDEKQ